MTSGPTLDELTECRNTIGRMDTLLEDLRKYGFSLVTGLLTASSLVGATSAPAALPLAAMVIIVLVLALFGIDMYYQVVLSAAVGRAMDIEKWTHDPEIHLTSSISRNATLTHATSTVFFLYSALDAVAMGMGLFGGDRLAPHLLTIVVAAIAFLIMLVYWLYVRTITRLNKPKPRVIGVLRAGRAVTVTVIGSRFERASRASSTIPGAHVALVDQPAADRPRYMDRRRDSAKVRVETPAGTAPGIYRLKLTAQEDTVLGEPECKVILDAPREGVEEV